MNKSIEQNENSEQIILNESTEMENRDLEMLKDIEDVEIKEALQQVINRSKELNTAYRALNAKLEDMLKVMKEIQKMSEQINENNEKNLENN